MLCTDMLGAQPVSEEGDDRLLEALKEMEAIDSAAEALAEARRAIETDPTCAAALLVVAAHAETRAERIALLKEVVSIWRRSFRPTDLSQTDWWVHRPTLATMAALEMLAEELTATGDERGAARCREVRSQLRLDCDGGARVPRGTPIP